MSKIKVFNYKYNPTGMFSRNDDTLEKLLNDGWKVVNSIPLGEKEGIFYATIILEDITDK